MRFLCLGYLEPAKMDGYSPSDVDALMGQCQPHLDELYASGHLVVDAGVELAGKRLRRKGGKVSVTDGPFVESKEVIGGVFIIEAKDMDEAIRIASIHPTTRMPVGEELGWRLDIRPIHHFTQPGKSG